MKKELLVLVMLSLIVCLFSSQLSDVQMIGKRIPALAILNLNLENVSENSTSPLSGEREIFARDTNRTDIFFEDFDRR